MGGFAISVRPAHLLKQAKQCRWVMRADGLVSPGRAGRYIWRKGDHPNLLIHSFDVSHQSWAFDVTKSCVDSDDIHIGKAEKHVGPFAG